MYSQGNSRGMVNVWVALLLTVFIAFVGLAIDEFYAVFTAQQLQIGADAAALAGAQLVRIDQTQARTAAVNIAAANKAGGSSIGLNANSANTANGDVVIGRYHRQDKSFTVTTVEPNAVKINSRRTSGSVGGPLSLFFGGIFGSPTAQPARYAIGMVGGELPIGLLVLNKKDKKALNVGGTSSALIINNGAIYVDSANALAASASGNPVIQAQEILISGGMDPSFTNITFGREVFTGVDPIADPLAGLPEPTRPLLPGIDVKVSTGNVVPLVPGYYTSITQTGGTIVMAPGVYYVDGKFSIKGNLTANNVMIFLGPSGSFDVQAGGTVTITPMDPLTYFPTGPSIPSDLASSQVSIFQARSNSRDANIIGGASMNISGRIYMPNVDATLHVGGGGALLGSGLIVGKADIQGNGNTINATSFVVPKDLFIFLVE